MPVASPSGDMPASPSPSAELLEVAATLRNADRAVILWGDRITREGDAAATALLDVAAALNLAEKDGSGLLEIPELANARGLREAGCLPDAGPGLSEIGSAPDDEASPIDNNHTPPVVAGKSTEKIRAALESGELKSLVLFGADPLRDFPDTAAWKRALAAADHLVVFSTFENETTAMADVVFPLETHAEKDGTVTHPDGRLQRVRPSAGRPGEIRPNWGVLATLSQALGHDLGIDSQPTAFAALTKAVPFYADISDADIAGRGIRWQDTPASSSFPVTDAPSASEGDMPVASPSSLLLGTYRDLWAGPITELNPPLRFLKPEQRVELSPADAARLGIETGNMVAVSQNGATVEARAQIRERTPEGACFLIEATAEGNANALLNDSPVAVEITKLSPPAPGRGSDRASQPDSREDARAEEAGGT